MQYKSIAQVNEVALKQIEAAHEEYKTEVLYTQICYLPTVLFLKCLSTCVCLFCQAEKLKCSQEAEISALREKICELQNESIVMSKEAASASHDKEEALESANAEITKLKHECAAKTWVC